MSDISDMMYEQGFHDGYQQALSELNSKKFEKVTRCKDCKFGKPIVDWSHIVCTCPSSEPSIQPGDWFCAYGKPKEGEGA